MRAFSLNPSRTWPAAPGCRILIVDGGAVRFDFPRDWLLFTTSKYVCLADRLPPFDSCWIGVSWNSVRNRAPLPLALLLQEVAGEQRHPFLRRGRIERFFRFPLEAAWMEARFPDVEDARIEVPRARICVARSDGTQALIFFEFRSDAAACAEAVWETALKTLAVGDYIEDFSTGRRRIQRG